MTEQFQGKCLPVLIGSLPLKDHDEASKLVLRYTPDIPIWAQLPTYKEEGMVAQFLPGFPGLTISGDKKFIDTSGDDFDAEILGFYEDYIRIAENGEDISESRFALSQDTAGGFFALLNNVPSLSSPPTAVKGQVTGPITFCTGLKDQDGRAVFYDDQLRDVALKHLAMKARWQVEKLSRFGCPVIIFFDEPALAGFGSSEFISITREEITACLNEVFKAVQKAGGLAGIHVCANTDWSMILESTVDIVNFDAYSYFDRFIIYPEPIIALFASGRMLAWGLVPTLNADDIEKETIPTLVASWEEKCSKIEDLGIKRSDIFSQSLITPSCGAGSLSVDHAVKVLELTKGLSDDIRSRM